jgi:hypothetical protein
LTINFRKWFDDEREHAEHPRHRKEKKEKAPMPTVTVGKDRERDSSLYEAIIVDTSSTSLSSNRTENCDEIEVEYEVSLNHGERKEYETNENSIRTMCEGIPAGNVKIWSIALLAPSLRGILMSREGRN